MTGTAPTMQPRASSEARGLDFVRLPLVGRFLRWKHARLALQIPLGFLAVVLVVDGLFGSQLAPKNLATLLVWVHWRGALVIALLLVGNLFCMGCPLLLPRELARRFFSPVRRLPRALRNKWTGLSLLVLVLFTYEWLDLWGSPRATAILILVYFGAALATDAFFRGASFCKWVCPIGQFNFLSSTLSPFEVRAKDLSTCESCRTKDCIRGTRAKEQREVVTQRGCELALFLPRKVGNVDCTFCLDCVHACPEDNVAISARVPAEELAIDPMRSGIGRFSRRPDLAALVLVFTFGALLNAFGMVSPVYALQRWLSGVLGTTSDFVLLSILFTFGLVLLPAVLLGAVTIGVRSMTGAAIRPHAMAFVYTLLPFGFGVWLAHYSFHFLTGLWTFVPVAQHTLVGLGVTLLGEPEWGLGGLTEAQVWPIELGFLALGTLGSLSVAWRLSARDFPQQEWRAFAPWATLHLALATCALWLLAQPMEMRGTFL